jgi:hypothetical protein
MAQPVTPDVSGTSRSEVCFLAETMITCWADASAKHTLDGLVERCKSVPPQATFPLAWSLNQMMSRRIMLVGSRP